MSNVEIPKKQIGILTAVGEKKINALAAMGKQVNIAQIVVGDGDPLELDRDATDLEHRIGSIPVIYKANGVLSGGFLYSPAIANMYDWEKINEVGLVDSDGDFIGWCFFDAKAVDLFVNRVVMIRVPVISSDVSDDLVTQQQLQVVVDVVNKQSAAIKKLNDDKLDKTENSTDTNHVNGVESEFVIENKTGSIAFKPKSLFSIDDPIAKFVNLLLPEALIAGRVSINLQLRSNANFSNLIISGQYRKVVIGEVDTYEWTIPYAQLTSGDIALDIKYGVNDDHRLAIEISGTELDLQNSAVIIESVSITGFDSVEIDAISLLTDSWIITAVVDSLIIQSHEIVLLTDTSRDTALDTLQSQQALAASEIVKLQRNKLDIDGKAKSAEKADSAMECLYVRKGDALYGVDSFISIFGNVAPASTSWYPKILNESATSFFVWINAAIAATSNTYIQCRLVSVADNIYVNFSIAFAMQSGNTTNAILIIESATNDTPDLTASVGISIRDRQSPSINIGLSRALVNPLFTVTAIQSSVARLGSALYVDNGRDTQIGDHVQATVIKL